MESNPISGDEARNWLELPADITSMILLKLGAIEILSSAQSVCSLWRKICKDPLMWRVVDMHNMGEWDMDYDLEQMCIQAVDRSCGELIDINIQYFGTNELLQYITQSSNQLRRLRIVRCHSITDTGLSEAVSKLPLLEHLEISLCSFTEKTLETVGRCCRLLKSLKLDCQDCRRGMIDCDRDAIAIAENMPNLRYLQIFGSSLTDRGLQAILDGCPDLESLDLRQCFNLDLVGQLGVECAERIKHLRLPHDPTDDYEFIVETDGFGDDDSLDEDYPSGFSDIDFLTEDDDYYEWSGGSNFSDYADFYFD
ncbi:F-box protein SKIP19-like [Momordica charantia]|uniref:F-box protein SKIP19-like n=1 Tax=Momordica charantia TaxID=3673 RepID=A0A6J1CXS5_MOMCH|nr:F-box protein SKIP19-like [Momordica charantia]